MSTRYAIRETSRRISPISNVRRGTLRKGNVSFSDAAQARSSARPPLEPGGTKMKSVWGAVSLVALTLGTIGIPSANTLQCADASLSSVSACGAHERVRPTARRQIARTERLKALPNQSDAARVGSEAKSCDISRQIAEKARDTALAKNCVTDPARTSETPTDKAPTRPLAPTSPKPQRAGIGTVFAINGAGEFLTNYHVVKRCTTAPRVRIAGEWQDGRAAF